MLSFTFAVSAQEKISTLYYDKDGRGVEDKELADYYREVSQNTYQTFQLNGPVMSAGEFICIDKANDMNSEFKTTIAILPTTIRDHGRYHVLNLTIVNNSESPIKFDPSGDITAESIQTKKGEATPLKVFSCEEFLKKFDRRSAIGSAFVSLSGGLDIIEAGFPDKSGMDLGEYHPFHQFIEWRSAMQTQQDFESNISNARDVYTMGYLKTSTIQPGESAAGFVYIERIKGDEITVSIELNGQVYTFTWNY